VVSLRYTQSNGFLINVQRSGSLVLFYKSKPSFWANAVWLSEEAGEKRNKDLLRVYVDDHFLSKLVPNGDFFGLDTV
jgi:hypothetical protein